MAHVVIGNRRILRVVLLTVVVFAAGLASQFGSDASGAPPAELKALLRIGAQETRLAEGRIVAKGAKTNDGLCDFGGSLTLIQQADNSHAEGRIVVQVDDSCELLVREVSYGERTVGKQGWFRGLPARTAAASHLHYRGLAESDVNDFAGIDLTETQSFVSYWYDGITVGGHDPIAECDVYWTSGWIEDGCGVVDWDFVPSYDHSPLYVQAKGDFHNSSGCCYHSTWAKFSQDIGSHSWECAYSNPLPPGTNFRCGGSRTQI